MRQDLKELVSTVENDLGAIRKYNRSNEEDNAKVDELNTKAVSEIRQQASDMKRLIDKLSRDAEKEVEKQFEPIQESIDGEFKDSAQRHQSLTQFRTEVMKMLDQEKDHEVINNYKALLRKYDETSENVFSSWFRMDRELEKLENVFKKGVIHQSELDAMLGSVEDHAKPNPDAMPKLEELKNDSYTVMVKKRFNVFRKSRTQQLDWNAFM